ncbi:MAG: sigma-70 family RNA polymerase sigma factor [Candidatus Eisenbacteria bacterium]|nr:sigma-70 family RNA polymerase sigma factor [Candidatus Eisenbacteria bacterium]
MEWKTTRLSLLDRLADPTEASAWREFDHLYGEPILRCALRSGLQLADAEDVRQTVLLGLVSAMPRFRFRPDLGRFRSYLGRSVTNAVTRQRKRRARDLERARQSADPVPQISDLDEIWEDEWRNRHLRAAFAEIQRTHDPSSVRVFERLLAGDPPEEIALEFSLRVDAVYKIKQRIRDRMRDLIQAQTDTEEREFACRN